jgi:mannose-6-phosphate isomerase-like protein (cupin superfamily)
MSDYTVTNLKEVEDAAVGFGLSPDLEARFARRPLESDQVAVSYQRLAPGVRTPFGHRHARQEEIYVVLGGAGRIKIGDETIDVGPWDAIRVAPEAIRAFEAGPEGVELLAIGAPLGEENDAELVQGWWGG